MPANSKEYRAANKERIKETSDAWRARNREHMLEVRKAYRIANRDHLRAMSKAWNDRNREKINETQRRKRADDPERFRDYQVVAVRSESSKARDRITSSRPERRFTIYKQGARSRGLCFRLTLDRFRELFASECAYCGESPSRGVDRIDSSIGYIESNCAPCCGRCNCMKLDLPPR